MELFENVIAMWNGGLDFIYNVSNWLKCPSPCPNTLTKQIFLYWVYRAFQVALVTKKKKKKTHTQKKPANAGDIRDVGLIPESKSSPGRGHATHSSILAWGIPWREEPGGPQPIGSPRVGHDWSD